MLALLSRGDRYGYDVSELLSRKIDISDGSVYPILRKLKAEGLVTAYLSEDSGGPPRKYYRLWGWAKRNTGARAPEWLTFAQTVGELLKEEQK